MSRKKKKGDDTMDMAINKPRESTIILKDMTKAFIKELAITRHEAITKSCDRISKEVSSSVMEQMKQMCEDDKK